jgi:hypothetical protein
MSEDARPFRLEHRVVRARWYGDVQLGARGRASPDFVRPACAGIQMAAILVDVGEDQIRIVLEAIVDAVAMVGIDVDVGDTFESVISAQHFDRHAAIVEYTEARGRAARSVVQPGDRHEGATRAACHDFAAGEQSPADHIGSRFINAAPRRRVSRVQESFARQRCFRDQVEVLRRVEGFKFLARRRARFHDTHAFVEPTRGELGEKRGVTVLAEGMAIAESITCQALARHQKDGCGRRR